MKQKTASANGDKDYSALVEALNSFKQDVADRIEDLEDRMEERRDGQANLRLVELTYNTDDTHILELSNISGMQVRPIAAVKSLEHIGDPKVVAGEQSLAGIYVNYILRGRRSVDGKHLGRGVMLAEGQIESQGEGEEGVREIDMGREK